MPKILAKSLHHRQISDRYWSSTHSRKRVLHNGLGHPDKYQPCEKLVELVEAGRLGNKTGWGVYDYREAAATS